MQFHHTNLVGEVYWRQFYAQLPSVEANGWILDAGCGDGKLTCTLSTITNNLVGFDTDPRWIQSKATGPTFVEHDVLDNNPDWHKKFDLVIGYYLLQQLPNVASLDKALSNLTSYLKPGGVLSVAIPHPCFIHLAQFPWEKMGFCLHDYMKHSSNYISKIHPEVSAHFELSEYHYPLSDYFRLEKQELTVKNVIEPIDVISNHAIVKQVPFALFISYQKVN